MVVISYLAPLVALAGLLLFVLATNPKVVRIGEIMLFAGLLVSLMLLAHYAVRI